jgi:aspartyl protease family protein
MTANGTVTVYETKVPTLILGNIPFNNVQAHLNPGMRSDKILLGMNVLKDLQFTQTNQQLTITIPR